MNGDTASGFSAAQLAGLIARLALVLVLLALLIVPRAQANHIAGATYTGNHAGTGNSAGGGIVEFDVASDGTQVMRLKVTNLSVTVPRPGLPDFTCTLGGVEERFIVSGIPIVNHTFSATIGGGRISFSGSFPGIQSAQGTWVLDWVIAGVRCLSGAIPWTATTTAQPPPPPDRDGDGVPDSSDACPTQAASTPNGCPSQPVSDRTAPTLLLGGSASQSALRQKGVVVVVQCPSEDCTATARGTVSVPKAAKVYRLKSVTKRIARGGKAKLKLRFSKKALRAIKGSLRKRKKLKAKVTVSVSDAAGNATTKRRSVRLKR